MLCYCYITQKKIVLLTYDHQNFTATAVVGYHRTNTANAVFYSVLGGLSGCCFLITALHYSAQQHAATVI